MTLKTFILLITLFLQAARNDMAAYTRVATPVPAFPGAAGGGMFTTGGRGGKVIKVTNLNDSGPGSFREAIRAKGSRTVVFELSGTIEIQSEIAINNGDLTIAGQTAPGDGICIKGHEVRISANNVIIRFIRFRLGDVSRLQCDALTGMGNKNIIIDHCSLSWSVDETVSFYDNEDLTMQWCIISESLNNSFHSKGPHGYGGIWGGKNASFLYNILAHHHSRNPRLQGARYNPKDGTERTELINNIVYNWGDKAIYGGENGQYNIINNIFIPGPATAQSKRDEILDPYEPLGKFYLKGNTIYLDKDLVKAVRWDFVTGSKDQKNILKANRSFTFKNKARVMDTKAAYDRVLTYAGTSLFRDAVDERIIREIKERTFTYGKSGIIDSQEETGGWPILLSTMAPRDFDGDGIPDEWESSHGINPSDPNDGKAFSINAHYTNLEVYLNDIVEKKHGKQ